MSRPAAYLPIPTRYAEALGGLRWCASGEAVEYVEELPAVGLVFALAPEIGRFLDGFTLKRPAIHFGHVLHLLHLLGLGRGGAPDWATELSTAFYSGARPLGNAGVFCAAVTEAAGVPPVPMPPDRRELSALLSRSSAMDALARRWAAEPWAFPAAEPSLSPGEFEARVRALVEAYSYEDLEGWFRHGRGPVKDAAEPLARAVEDRPRTISGALAPLLDRDRLRRAAPMVSSLVGALALPPRKLARRELPLGGYVDVTNRGNPEQILPGQFALDPAEFLRRFAEKELLFYHREEPHAPRTEELVAVLDQGVRTWGDARLMLAAALVALGRRAERAGLRFRVATTSGGGTPDDPLALDAAALAARVEASDLSPDPGAALARAIESAGEAPGARDVVLLTHPRNLHEPAVAEAARRAEGETRVFALAVDAEGRAQLAELRRGAPVTLARFRVGLPAEAPPEPEAPAPAGPHADPKAWTGDVEPVPFPFALGVGGRVGPRCFDLDDEGKYLLAAAPHGFLHLIRADGSGQEMLPRGMFERGPARDVEQVIGVKGGFVVVARSEPGVASPTITAFHYDLASRRCRAHELKELGRPPSMVAYLGSSHVLIGYVDVDMGVVRPFGIDLATGTRSGQVRSAGAGVLPSGPPPVGASPLRRAVEMSRGMRVAPPLLEVDPPEGWPGVRLDTRTGTLSVVGAEPPWKPFKPESNGRPALGGVKAKVVEARLARDVLAATFEVMPGTIPSTVLRLFRGPEGDPLGEHPMPPSCPGFALSGDGSTLARRLGWRTFHVRDARNAADRGIVTPKGRHHDAQKIVVGDSWLAAQAGKRVHLFRWDRPRLEVRILEGDVPRLVAEQGLPGEMSAMPGYRARETEYDTRRFLFGQERGLRAAVDVLGQIAYWNKQGSLVAMFFAFKQTFAAWMPDGTRMGSPALNGGPETPGAAAKLAEALRKASGRGA